MKRISVIFALLLTLALLISTVPSVKGVEDVWLNVQTDRSYYFKTDNVSITVNSNNASPVALTILDPLKITVLNITTSPNATVQFTFPADAEYGLYTVKCGNVSTWFWLQKIDDLVQIEVPYSWTWKGVDYTLSADYMLTAEGFDGNFTLDWLSEIFVKLKPSATVYHNEYLVLIKTQGKDIDADHWLMNQHTGLKIRINGTLASPTTLKWNFKNLADDVIWRLNSFSNGHLNFDWSDYDRSGVSYTMDKTNLKMDVYLSTVFDIDPTIFESGFESGGIISDGWDGKTESGGTIDVSTSNPAHGTYHARSNITGTGTRTAYCYKSGFNETRINVREYVYFHDRLAFGTSDEIMVLAIWGQTSVLCQLGIKAWDAYWGGNYRKGGVWQNWANLTLEASLNTEYCLEAEFYVHATEGWFKAYLDDTLIFSDVNINTSGYGNIEDIRCGVYRSKLNNDYAHVVDVDSVVVDNSSYIGPEAGNNAPTIGEFGAPSTVYANQYFYLNATVDDQDGISDIVNATIEISNDVILKWDNATAVFSEHQDSNNYCTLNASESVRTTLNGTAYRLSWRIKLYWNYTEGNVSVISTNTIVFDNSGLNGTNSQADLFYFEDDLIVFSANYLPSNPVVNQPMSITGQLYYQGTSTAPEDPSGITAYTSKSGIVQGSTTSFTAGTFAIDITAPSSEGTYEYLVYSVTVAGSSVQNQTVEVLVHPSGEPPIIGPITPPTTEIKFFGSLVSLGSLTPGQDKNFQVFITWVGTNEITITSMEVSLAGWVYTPQGFPQTFWRGVGEANGTAYIAMTLNVPSEAIPKKYEVSFVFTVEAASIMSQVSCVADFEVYTPSPPSPTQNIQNIIGLILAGCLGIVFFGAFITKKKRKSPV